MAKILFETMTWPEVKEAAEAGSVVILPVGSIEQHGPHLPINTDSSIISEIAKEVGESLQREGVRVLVAPTICYGYSAADAAEFPGTISVRLEILAEVLVDVCKSLIRSGFRKIVLLNGHGHNGAALEIAERRIRDETGVALANIPLYIPMAAKELSTLRKSEPGGMSHAGELETSLQLLMQPELVQMDKAVKAPPPKLDTKLFAGDMFGGAATDSVLRAAHITSWCLWKTDSGVMGDPTVATRESGEKFLKAIVRAIAEFVKDFVLKVKPYWWKDQ